MAKTVKTHSKIVGTTFEGRQALIAKARFAKVEYLNLVREYDNKYDPNAVAVCADLYTADGEKETIQLGYISNSTYMCKDCGFFMDGRGRAPKACCECGSTELVRRGLASDIAESMSDGIAYKCKVTEYTGGGENKDTKEEKNLGVNIYIEPIASSIPV